MFGQAIDSNESVKWIEAMREEMHSIISNNVLDVQDLPHGRKKVRRKWVYDVKKDSDGNTVRHKARLVAKGFTQKEGIDYHDVFSPVPMFETLRFLQAFVAAIHFELEQIDIKTAFLNGHLQEEIYMDSPPLPDELVGEFNASEWTGKVWKLSHSLYGLKQASKVWSEVLDKVLQSNGFKQAEADPCLFIHVN